MIHFEDYSVLETIEPPGTAVETGAQDHQLIEGRGALNGAIQDHCTELIEEAYPALPKSIRGSPATCLLHAVP